MGLLIIGTIVVLRVPFFRTPFLEPILPKPLEFSADERVVPANTLPQFTIRGPRGLHVQNLELISPKGKQKTTGFSVFKDANGGQRLAPTDQTQFYPGRYEAIATVVVGGNTETLRDEFYWGVVAVNVRESVVESDVTQKVEIAVLDDFGRTVCDSRVDVVVTDPADTPHAFRTEDGGVQRNPNCRDRSVTNEPDYDLSFVPSAPGTYAVVVTATTKDGTRRVEDHFVVLKKPEFRIVREAFPTRIYPPADYPVEFTITSEKKTTVVIEERVPAGFLITNISDSGALAEDSATDERVLRWDVTLEKHETHRFGYTFDAPNISPLLYTDGPIRIFGEEGKELFREAREWQIAADATKTWDGGGLGDQWSDCTNWNNNLCPNATGDDILFDGTSNDPSNWDSPSSVTSVASITVTSMSGSLTFTKTPVTITGDFSHTSTGNVVFAGSAAITVGGNFTLTTSGTLTPNTSTLTMNGTAGNTLNTAKSFYKLTIDPASPATISTTANSPTVTNALIVETDDTLSIGGLFLTSSSAGTVTINGTISGPGTLVVRNPNLGTGGTLSAPVRFDPNIVGITMPARTYGSNVEIYNNDALSNCSVTMGAGTHDITGNLTVNATSTINCTLTATTNNPSVNVTGDLDYTGAGSGTEITQSGTGVWTVGGNVDFTSGTFTATAGNILAMNGSSKTLTSASQTLQNLTLSSSITLANATHTVAGNLNMTGATITAGTSTVTMSGTGGKTIDGGNVTLRNLTIDPSSAATITVQTAGFSLSSTLSVAVDDTFSIPAGISVAVNSTVTLNGTISGDGGIVYTSLNTFPITGTITCDLSFNASNSAPIVPGRTYGGDLEIFTNNSMTGTGGATLGSGLGETIIISGNFSVAVNNKQHLQVDGLTNSPDVQIGGNIDYTGTGSGSESIDMGIGLWTVTGSIDFSNGSATHDGTLLMNGTANLTANNTTFFDLVIDGNANTVTVTGSNTKVSGTLTIGNVADSNSDTLDIASGFSVTSTDISSGVVFSSSGTDSITGSGTLIMQNSSLETDGTLSSAVRFDATSGDLTMPTRTYGGNVEIYNNSSGSARTVTPNAGTQTISGNLTLGAFNTQNVTFAGATNNPTMSIGGSVDFTGTGAGAELVSSGINGWTVSGSVDFTGGTFTAASGHLLTMDGTGGDDVLVGNGQSLYNVTINPTSSATITAQTSNLTITNLLTVAATDTLSIAAETTVTLSGTSGTTVTLNGTISGAGRLTYSSTSAFPTGGTLSAVLRMDTTGRTGMALSDRAGTDYGPVEVYNNDATFTSVTFEIGTGASQTITLGGNFSVICDSNQGVSVNVTNSPTVNITGGIDFTGIGGGTEQLSMGSSTWTVGGSIDFTDGIVTGGTSTLVMNGSGVALTSGGNAVKNFEVAGTVSTTDAANIDGTFSVSSGSFTQGANVNMNVSGTFTLSASTTFVGPTGTGTLIFDGDLTATDNNASKQNLGNVQVGTSPDTLNLGSDMLYLNLTVASGDFFYTNGYDVTVGGNLTINGTLDTTDDVELDETTMFVAGNFTINAGAAFVQNQSTLVMNGTSGTKDLTTNGAFSLYNLTLNDGGGSLTVEVEDALDVDNDITITGGTLDATVNESNPITVGRNWSNTDRFTAQLGTVTFDSGQASSIPLIDSTGANVDDFYDIIFDDNAASVVFTLESPLDVNNNLTITAGSELDVKTGENNQINIAGNFDDDGTFLAKQGLVLFDAPTGTKTIDALGEVASPFSYLTFNDGGGSAIFQLTTAADVDRDLTITGGTLDANSNDITVGGNWTNSDLFSSGTQTVIFDAIDADNAVEGGSSAFSSVTFSGTGGGNGTWTIQTTDAAATATVDINAGDTLSIASGRLFTQSGATLTLNGTIAGAGTYVYQSATTFPITGTVSANLRFDATNGNQTTSARSYGANLEAYSNAGVARVVTLSIGVADSYVIAGSFLVAAANSGILTVDGAAQNPSSVAVAGNLDYTGAGGGNETLVTGTGMWTVSGNVDLSGGTMTATSGNTLQMNGSAKTVTNALQTVHNFSVTGGSISSTDAMDVNGAFQVTSGSFSQASNADLHVAGNFSLASGTTFVRASGSGLLFFDGDLSFSDATSPKQNIGVVRIGTSPDTLNLASDMTAKGLTVNSGDIFLTNGYDITVGSDGIAVYGTLDATDDVEADETNLQSAGSFSLYNGATFARDQSTVTMNGSSGSADLVTDGPFSLYNLTIDDGGGSLVVVVVDALDIDNNVTITGGTLAAGSNAITVGGSWDNNDIFDRGTGTVTFDAATTGKTIEAGNSAFATLLFNNALGGWTIQTNDATVESALTLTAAASWTLQSGRTIEVQGDFQNALGGAATTWSGSALYLNGTGGAYDINTKTASGDTYGTLHIGATEDIAMWNSDATLFSVDSGGSLLSQDHAGVDGRLHIYGSANARTNEYWSYATDFDGVALGTPRKAEVRFAENASMTVDVGDTLTILGGSASSARTLMTRQTSGTFSLTVNGLIHAQYYDVEYLSANGLVLNATATVTSLSNGSFDHNGSGGGSSYITVNGISSIMVLSEMTFDTAADGADANVVFNVNANGPGIVWTMSVAAGNRAGESFDQELNGAMVTWTPTFTEVNDGIGVDVDATTSATQLSANWVVSELSGIDHFVYAIGTTAGGTDILPFTSAGLTTNVTKTGLSLLHGTTYYIAVQALNANNDTIVQGGSDGITVDTISPVLSNIQVSATLSSLTIRWDSDEETTTKVRYGLTADYGSETTENTALTTDHTVSIAGLANGTSYHFQALGTDRAGNIGTSADQVGTTSALEATVITNVLVTPLSPTVAQVTWTTNHLADSKVRYGKSTDYGKEVYSGALVTSHVLLVTDLEPNVQYHYEAISTGNTVAIDADATFTTPSISAPTILRPTEGEIVTTGKPLIIGLSKSQSDVFVILNDVVAGIVKTRKSSTGVGDFSFRVKKALVAGEHTLRTVSRDTEGNTSVESSIRAFIVTLPYPAPTVFPPIITDGAKPTVTIYGLSKNNSTLNIFLDNDLYDSFLVGSAFSGAVPFRRTLTSLAAGRHTIQLQAKSPGGKLSALTSPITFTLVKSRIARLQLFPGQPVEYIVKVGDSLWRISEYLYGKGSLWKKIIQANLELFPRLGIFPAIIQPGWLLKIPK